MLPSEEQDLDLRRPMPSAPGVGSRLTGVIEAWAQWAGDFFSRVGCERSGLRLIKPFG